MNALAAFALGPLLYLAACSVASVVVDPLPDSFAGKVASAALGSVLAVLSLARSGSVALGRDRAVGLGLAALAVGIGLGSPEGAPGLRFAHASLLLAAAAGLGEAFASVVEPRLRQASVLVTAGVCLALFDGWSVLFGPAGAAAEGGLLQRLLLDAPAPGGPIHIIGVSDLVVIGLLAGLARLRDWGRAKALVAGWVGLELALVQVVLTRRPAPALPWIGLAFCAAHWRQVRPDAEGWRRTGRWAVGSAAVLAGLSGVLQVMHRS